MPEPVPGDVAPALETRGIDAVEQRLQIVDPAFQGVFVERVARPGEGRSGGYRMVIAYRSGQRAVFLYGFAKNERDNIGQDELRTLREIGAAWLEAEDGLIERAIADATVEELTDGRQDRTA